MKKYLLCTSSSDNFAIGTAVMIYSLRKNTEIFKQSDIKVFYNNLSKDNMNMINDVCGRVEFVPPKDVSYCSGASTIYGPSNTDVYLCFESFRYDQYEKVMCFDSDMLCIKDMSDMIHNTNDFGACHKGNEFRRWGTNKDMNYIGRTNKYHQINAGLFVIGKKFLGNKIYDALRKIVKKKTYKSKSADQTTLNMFFLSQKNMDIYMFPDEYNFRYWGGGGMGTNELATEMWSDIKNIHYSGRRKPWGDNSKSEEDMCSIKYFDKMAVSEAYKIWHIYYEECFNKKFKLNEQS